MALAPRTQLKYWGIAAVIFFVLLWALGDILLPFILGGAVAYFLDPVADRLERWGLSRTLAVTVITIVAVLLFVAVIVPAAITLEAQVRRFINSAPEFLESVTDPEGAFLQRFPFLAEYRERIATSMSGVVETIQERSGAIVSGLVAAGQGLLGVGLLFVIVPVVAFYLLLDWDRMVARVDDLLPREHAPTIRRLAAEIDRTLSSFIRGQGTVMLILGIYYAAALMIAGLNFGIIVGLIAGLVTFIPYAGAVIGGALAIGIALVQFWGEWGMVAIIAAIFASGQMLEGNVLTPKLVGGSVGLHPVWLLFALAVFGALFGFVGLLVAVPVAASLGVIARFLVEKYRASTLYRGSEAPLEPPAE